MQKVEIDLPERFICLIAGLARRFSEIEKVVIFGSRALGNAKRGSDIDLAVMGVEVTPQVVMALYECLSEDTNMPYFFDIIHYEAITNPALREHISQYGKVLYVKET